MVEYATSAKTKKGLKLLLQAQAGGTFARYDSNHSTFTLPVIECH